MSGLPVVGNSGPRPRRRLWSSIWAWARRACVGGSSTPRSTPEPGPGTTSAKRAEIKALKARARRLGEDDSILKAPPQRRCLRSLVRRQPGPHESASSVAATVSPIARYGPLRGRSCSSRPTAGHAETARPPPTLRRSHLLITRRSYCWSSIASIRSWSPAGLPCHTTRLCALHWSEC
jgi:hypothetical protein